MKVPLLAFLFVTAVLAASAAEKTESAAPSSPAEESAPAKNADAPATPLVPTDDSVKPPPSAKPPAPSATGNAAAVNPPPEAPTTLPSVEVRKRRLIEIDRQAQEKEQEIAHEKQNAKATEMDRGLNDSKVSGFLSIFGGASSQRREALAQERLMLLEMERELVEQMKQARTKAEKQELQKQLHELRTMRRKLDSPDR